jgi:ABC-type polysaccharide/polyol phosphate transport system ATPase subunit
MPMSAEIDLCDIHVRFQVRPANRVSLKEYLVRGLFRPAANPLMDVNALRGVTLRVREGERLGIIGHNGAGKSTLLKVIAGIYPPTSGSCRVTGRICSLFDIMVGFEMEASGWDNIRFRAYLQGETPRTLREKLPAIAEFSELERFLNVPLKYYSAGMLARLAFSIASATEPEVLLIDEALAAGDVSFRAKARRRVTEMMESARLMVLISHDLKSLAELCTKAAWMERGEVRMLGPCDEVIAAYRERTARSSPVGAAA